MRVLLFISSCLLLCAKAQDQSDALSRLRHKLLTKYDTYRVPNPYPNNGTTISIGVTIRGFEIDEQYVRMIWNGWIKMFWDDPRFKWVPSQHANLKQIRFKPSDIWIPDILPYNSAEAHTTTALPYQMTYIIANYTGNVIWVPPATFKMRCESEAYWWPRDSLTCQLKMGPWTHNNYDVQVQHMPVHPEEQHYVTRDGDWKIEKVEGKTTTKTYPCCPEPYSDVKFTMTLQRQGVFYMATLGSILIVVVIITLLVFMLPSNSEIRIHFVLFNLLLLAAMLFFCNIFMPIPERKETPAAMRLLIGLSAMQVIMLLGQIIVYNLLEENVQDLPLGPLLRRFPNLEKKPAKEQVELQETESKNRKVKPTSNRLVVLMNQLGFFVIFIILLICCLSLWSF